MRLPKRSVASHSYRNEASIGIIKTVKRKIIHGDTNQCFLTEMFISSNVHGISFAILYDLNKVGRFQCPDYLKGYAIGGISSWLGHLCNSGQRVEA